jgi:hypothetical protein
MDPEPVPLGERIAAARREARVAAAASATAIWIRSTRSSMLVDSTSDMRIYVAMAS